MQAHSRTSENNSLLQALSQRDRRSLLAGSGTVALVYGQVLHQPMEQIDRIYFPTSGFVSLIVTVDDPAILAVGLVGNEGMCGVSLAMGVNVPRVRAGVQGAGSALSLDTGAFVLACANSRSLTRLMGRYACFQLDQSAQLAACTRFHQIEARLARWLLMTLDRTQTDECNLTHELLSMMLGVRRVGITNAAGELQRRHLIRYSRGNIRVLDRGGLEAVSCSCYAADRQSYAQINTG
jgi:CRP-like cAMP-binding protein